MKKGHYSRLTHISIFLALQGLSVISHALAICYKTPQTAIDANSLGSKPTPGLTNDGYRVTRIQRDPVLGKGWAMIVSCDHPEQPAIAVPLNTTDTLKVFQQVDRASTANIQTAIVVRAGDVVRLWRQENLLRIEVGGVSEESGGLGKTIRVRLMRNDIGDESIPEQLFGIIRGSSSVEMQP
jgi:hypothetical protein